MSNKTTFISEKRYFQYFEAKYKNHYFCKKYPRIAQRMEEICEEIKEKIHNLNNQKEDFFQIHAEILGLDAQLQIIILFLDNLSLDNFLTEEQILMYVRKDYRTFFEELCDIEYMNFMDNSLYFSII